MKNNDVLARIALAIPAQRAAVGLSLTKTAELAGVSRATLVRVERGQRVLPKNVFKLAWTLTLCELNMPSPSPPAKDGVLDDLAPLLAHRPPKLLEQGPARVLAQAARATFTVDRHGNAARLEGVS